MQSNQKTLIILKDLYKDDYSKKLSSCIEANRIVFDTEAIHPKQHSVIEIGDIILAIRHDLGGPYPIAKFVNNDSDLFVGVDSTLILVSLDAKKIVLKIELDTPFINVYTMPNDPRSTIVIEEGGVSRWDIDGNKNWFFGTDLITSHKILDKMLVISQLDSPDIKISLDTGKPI